jgi:hypothetical protein
MSTRAQPSRAADRLHPSGMRQRLQILRIVAPVRRRKVSSRSRQVRFDGDLQSLKQTKHALVCNRSVWARERYDL